MDVPTSLSHIHSNKSSKQTMEELFHDLAGNSSETDVTFQGAPGTFFTEEKVLKGLLQRTQALHEGVSTQQGKCRAPSVSNSSKLCITSTKKTS